MCQTHRLDESEGRSLASQNNPSVNDDSGKTPTHYSRQEAAHIRARAMNPDLEDVCPRCGQTLDIGPAVYQVDRRGGPAIRLLTCHTCHRCLSITSTPERARR